jgi:threonine dehydrogenase-like Zn-dependent dehydrogenase
MGTHDELTVAVIGAGPVGPAAAGLRDLPLVGMR